MTPDDEIRQELERVAQSEPRSGREAMAKVTALRTLERLNRPSDEAMVDPQIERRSRVGSPRGSRVFDIRGLVAKRGIPIAAIERLGDRPHDLDVLLRHRPLSIAREGEGRS